MPEKLKNIEQKTQSKGTLDLNEKKYLETKNTLRAKDISSELRSDLKVANQKSLRSSTVNNLVKIENFVKYPNLQQAMKRRFQIIDKQFGADPQKAEFCKKVSLIKAIMCIALRNMGQGALAAEIDFTKENASNFKDKQGESLERQIFSGSYLKCLHKFQQLTQDNEKRSKTDCVVGPKTIQQLFSYARIQSDLQKNISRDYSKDYSSIDYSKKENIQRDIDTINNSLKSNQSLSVHQLQSFLSHLQTIEANTSGELVDHLVEPVRKKIVEKIIVSVQSLPAEQRQKYLNNADNVIGNNSALKKEISNAKKTEVERKNQKEYDDAVLDLANELKDKGVTPELVNSLMAKIMKIFAVYGYGPAALGRLNQLSQTNPQLFEKIVSRLGPLHSGLRFMAESKYLSKIPLAGGVIGSAFQWTQLYSAATSEGTVGDKILNVGGTLVDIGKYMIPFVGNGFDFADARTDFEKGQYGSGVFNLTTGTIGLTMDVLSVISAPTVAGPAVFQGGKTGAKLSLKVAAKALTEGKGVITALGEAKKGVVLATDAITKGMEHVSVSVKKLATDQNARESLLKQLGTQGSDMISKIANAPSILYDAIQKMPISDGIKKALSYLIKETLEGVMNSLLLPFKLLGLKVSTLKDLARLLKSYSNKDIPPAKNQNRDFSEDKGTSSNNQDKKQSNTNDRSLYTKDDLQKDYSNLSVEDKSLFDQFVKEFDAAGSSEDAKLIYRQWSKKYHPDKYEGGHSLFQIISRKYKLDIDGYESRPQSEVDNSGSEKVDRSKSKLQESKAVNSDHNNTQEQGAKIVEQKPLQNINSILNVLKKGNIVIIDKSKYVFNGIKNGKAEFIPDKTTKNLDKIYIEDINDLLSDRFNLEPGNKQTNTGRYDKLKEILNPDKQTRTTDKTNESGSKQLVSRDANEDAAPEYKPEITQSNKKIEDDFREMEREFDVSKVTFESIRDYSKLILNKINDFALNIKKYSQDQIHLMLNKFTVMFSKFSVESVKWGNALKNQLQQLRMKIREIWLYLKGISFVRPYSVPRNVEKVLKSRLSNGSLQQNTLRMVEDVLAGVSKIEFNSNGAIWKIGEEYSIMRSGGQVDQGKVIGIDDNGNTLIFFKSDEGLKVIPKVNMSNHIKNGYKKEENVQDAKTRFNEKIKEDQDGTKYQNEHITVGKNKIEGFTKNLLSKLSKGFVDEYGLPKHTLNFASGKLYVTDVLQKGSRKYLVGYTDTGDVRVFYRSGSESERRSCPGMRPEGGFSKGESIANSSYETTTKLVNEVNNFFDTLPTVIVNSNPVEMSVVLSRKYGNMNSGSEFDFFGNNEFNIANMAKETSIKKMFSTYSNAVDFYRGKNVNDVIAEYSKLQVPGLLMDSMTLSASKGYSFRHEYLGSINVNVVQMKYNGRLVDVHFANAVGDQKVFVTNIVYSDAKINSFGIYSEQINAGPVTAKPLDYQSQLPIGANYKLYSGYMDIRDIYQEMPLIKEYKRRYMATNASVSHVNSDASNY